MWSGCKWEWVYIFIILIFVLEGLENKKVVVRVGSVGGSVFYLFILQVGEI